MTSSISSQDRSELIYRSLEAANQQLKTHHIKIELVGQWPPKKVENDEFDERPDIELRMHINGQWHPIDIIYIRQMPQMPEKLKNQEQLTRDIFKKAMQHLAAIENPNILISSAGSKYNLSLLKNHRFSLDPQEYIRINGMRVAFKIAHQELYKPIKGGDLRSHTEMRVEEWPHDILYITDDFNDSRTDGRKGMLCLLKKAVSISKSHLVPDRREEAADYEGKYIPMERVIEEFSKL